MPVYIYRCENCGVQFERHQSFTDEPLKRCPECSKNSLRKVLTPAGIVFKGSGWYATDHKSASGMTPRSHRNESKESSEKSEGGSGDSSSDSTKTKTESTPPASNPDGEGKKESASKQTE